MRRVGDELALRPRRVLERAQHRVEARGEPAELVAAAGVDALREVAGLRDVLRRAGQPAHGCEGRARHEQAEGDGDADAARGDQDQVEPDARERVVDLGQRARNLDRKALCVRHRDHAHVDSRDVGVGEKPVSLSTRDRTGVPVDGQLDLFVGKADGVAVRAHDLEVARCAAELRARPEASPRYAEARALHERMLANDRAVRPSYLPSTAREGGAARVRTLVGATARLPLSLGAAVMRHRPGMAVRNIWLPNNSRANLVRGIWTNYRERFRRPDHQGPAIRDPERIDFDFVFYPLQLEPEMTLMMWAPQFANQLELCRRLGMGLPAGVRLITKEHPNMASSRRASYYAKLRGLLNVELAHSSVPAAALFSHPRCRGVAVINSTAGFEAAMAGVPVAVLGPAEYDVLPVIERTTTYEAAIAALRRFCLEPRRPLSESDHRATVAYLAALLEEGFEADYQEVWTRGEGRVAPEVIADALERRLGMRMEGRR